METKGSVAVGRSHGQEWGENELMWLGAFNVSGMKIEGKRGRLLKGFKDRRLDVPGVGETHLLGKRMWGEGKKQDNMM